MEYYEQFKATEASFKYLNIIDFHRNHPEIPIIAVSCYLMLVFIVPRFITEKNKFNLKPYFAGWNLFLSIFSALGAYNTVPHMYNALQEHGFVYTICHNPLEWYSAGASGFWLTLFIYSKLPELTDTVFLVLQNKKVIFLHWYHHCTVLLYCWHAYDTTISAGLWFCVMNYSVHTVMYFYYFLMAVPLPNNVRKILRKIYAPLTTTIQVILY